MIYNRRSRALLLRSPCLIAGLLLFGETHGQNATLETKSLGAKSPRAQLPAALRHTDSNADNLLTTLTDDKSHQNTAALATPKDTEAPAIEFADKKKNGGCRITASSDVWVDKLRAGTHTRLCNTANWVDGLFGDEEDFRGEEFRGKVSLGIRHDEIDGIDPRLRVRIRTKLPNVSKRLNAFVGRVEEDSYVSNTEVNQDRLNNVGLRSTNDDESEWLVGLGYRTPTRDNNGWDASVGAKLSSGLSPYAKLAHRYLFVSGDDRFWRTEQTVFWRKRDGFGVSSKLDYTRIVNDLDIVVLQGNVKYTEEAEQWEWFTDATWHHSFSESRGVSSSIYARGEAENPVSIPEYGATFTYVRPILRDWIFLETGVDLRWERESPGASYKSAVRFGIQVEMLLGDYYRLGRYK